MTLVEFFKRYPHIAIGFSGGVDSAYLAYTAKQYAKDILAIYYKSSFQPDFELEDAKHFCKEHGIPLTIIQGDVLSDSNICSNPENRCYYCKKQIFSAIRKEAVAQGISILLDGTNASDSADDRPGMRALEELSVLSPLRLCGLTKDEIRTRSHEAGLFTWNKPAYACLATRIPTGMQITSELLYSVESCENILFSMGFKDFRVRVREDFALLQVTSKDYYEAQTKLPEIKQLFSRHFPHVILDEKTR